MNAIPRAPQRAQVVIVGAGPSGIATALRLAQRGVEDILLLDAADFPRHKTCGSGLSPACIQTLRGLGIWESIAPKTYPIEGMILVTPGGKRVDMPSSGLEVAICLRHDLDHAILQEALRLGVRFVPHFKATELIEEGGRVRGVRADDGREARGTWTVIATGAFAPMAVETGPKRQISTIMGWWEDVSFRPHWLEMVYDPEIVPYYGWLFPEGDNRVNIGITYVDGPQKRNAKTLFEGFLERQYGDRLKTARRIGAYRGHPIVWTYQIPRLWSPGRVVVGEAGRMTHPATGEGISQAMRSGIFAADALADVLEGGSAGWAFGKYQARCVAAFTPGFLAGGAFLKAATPGVIDALAGLTSDRWLGAMTRAAFVKV